MLKRSLFAMSLCGLLTSMAAAANYEFSISPNAVVPGERTEIQISLTNNTAGPAPFFVGGLVFNFSNPDGLLHWDLDGPDNSSNPIQEADGSVTPSADTAECWLFGDCGPGTADPDRPQRNPDINDDDFRFMGILDGILHPTNPPPGDFVEPLRPYFALHNPPSTALEVGPGGQAFRINAAGTTAHVASLWVTASTPPSPAVDDFVTTTLGLGATASLLADGSFNQITDLGGTETQEIRVKIPEPATMLLLAVGGLTVLRRRR